MTPAGYRPPRLLRNPHLQSAISSSPLRRRAGERALARHASRHETWLLDGGNEVRLQGVLSLPLRGEPVALALLLHGWEGSIESSYMSHTSARLLQSGYAVFRLNFRDHGDTHHLNRGLFHSCRLEEVVRAVVDLARRCDIRPLVAAGYSLGGNFALRLALAAPAAELPLRHAAAVCPAIDPANVLRALETGPRFYHWYFMRKWRASLRKKRALFPDHHNFDERVLAQDMRGLTRWLVERHTDKGSLDAYFDGYSVSGERLAGLRVPVSVLTAEDDPVIPIEDFRRLRLPDHSRLEIAPFGGHCGFLENWRMGGFAERWVVARLDAALAGGNPG